MRPLPLLTAVPCRTAEQACIACCRGRAVSEPVLAARLRRQTRLFARLAGGRPPGRWAAIAHELRARRGLDLLLAVLFLLPGVGPCIRRWARERMCCAFLGFEDADETRPGCLMHPSRWGGADVRRRSAFALLSGVGCSEPGYLCGSAVLYRAAGWEARRQFHSATDGMGWFAYSAAVEAAEDGFLTPAPAPASPSRG